MINKWLDNAHTFFKTERKIRNRYQRDTLKYSLVAQMHGYVMAVPDYKRGAWEGAELFTLRIRFRIAEGMLVEHLKRFGETFFYKLIKIRYEEHIRRAVSGGYIPKDEEIPF